MSNILVVFDVPAFEVAGWVAQSLRAHGHVTLLVRADGNIPPASEFDAVVVGSRVLFGQHARTITDYVWLHRAELEAMPTASFTVGSEGTFRYGNARRMGWHPMEAASFPVFTDPACVAEFAERFNQDVENSLHPEPVHHT